MTARTRFRDDINFLRTAIQIRVRDPNNVTQLVKRIRIRNTANNLKTVFQYMTATIAPPTASAYGSSGAAVNLTTGSVVASPDGGQSPFTYAWVQKTLSAYTWVIGTPTAAATNFTCNAVPAGVATSVDFEVTVTDAIGATATARVTATANNGLPYNPDTTDRSIDPRNTL
jgi:hypothetical protein